MQIREAKVFNFGKLQNVSFRFSEGVNVIYGENEQGKTTLHAFLTGMLFGMEKSRGRAAGGDLYTRYEPWHAPSFYSGALRFEVGEKPFYLERNFYNKERSEYLRNEADGEELSVTYGDLDILLGGISKEEFGNTYDIPQTGATTGKAMSELLTSYLAEAEAGGNGGVHVLEAQRRLVNRKKELSAECRHLQEEREQSIGQKNIELQVLRDNVTELKCQIATFEEEQQALEAKLEDRRTRLGKSAKIGLAVVTGLLVIVVAVTAVFAYMQMVPVAVPIVSGTVMLIAGILFWLPKKDGTEELLNHAKAMLTQIKEHLQENENEIINIEEEIEELQEPTDRERELHQNIEALELARSQIEKISEEYYLEMADEMNGEISKWISLLTKGTYDSARLDKNGKLLILAEEREVAPESLSRGTLEQIYLALRLAVGSVLMKEEDMPIFLDEAFAMYDDVRLAETLKALAKSGKQIFIFTCQKREAAILQQEAIAYHAVNMARESL